MQSGSEKITPQDSLWVVNDLDSNQKHNFKICGGQSGQDAVMIIVRRMAMSHRRT